MAAEQTKLIPVLVTNDGFCEDLSEAMVGYFTETELQNMRDTGKAETVWTGVSVSQLLEHWYATR